MATPRPIAIEGDASDSTRQQESAHDHILGGLDRTDWRRLTGTKGSEREPSWLPAGRGMLGDKDDSPLGTAGKEVFSHLPPEQQRQLQKEMDEYDAAVKRRAMQIGIGIPWPEPGPLMKEYEQKVEGVTSGAEQRVTDGMTKTQRDDLEKERKEYAEALERRGMQIGIGIPWPEPGPAMKHHDEQVKAEIEKVVAEQPITLSGGTAGTTGGDTNPRAGKEDPLLRGDKPLTIPGFGPDEYGFDQDAASRSESMIGQAWDGLKGLLGFGDTVGDRLKEGVEKKMSDQDREELHKQEKEYEGKRRQWMTQSTINPGEPPDINDYPMLVKRDQMVRDAEQAIVARVSEGLSQSDREQLDRERAEYERQWDDYTTIKNPYGTGEGFKPRPRPGAKMAEFQEKVAQAVEEFDA